MRIPSDSELIAVWERCSGEHPVDRALTLLSACFGESPEELTILSVGSRDARLLEVYDGFFGSELNAFAECPVCGEGLEYSLDARSLVLSPRNANASLTLETGEMRLQLRLPDSSDLRALTGCNDVEDATQLLVKRCVVEAHVGETPALIETLPQPIIDLIADRLAEVNPQAEILINLTCTACSHSWQVIFDIEAFLWLKISATVKRLLQQVHTLASAYGWRESDILALSSSRRQIYVEMAS